MDTINPYSTEIRYTLDLMGSMLHAQQPQSVRVYTDSVEMAKASVRRLAATNYRLFVDTPEICAAIQTSLGVDVEVAGTAPVDAAFVPLARQGQALPHERMMVAAVHNAFSYKSLLYPGIARTTAFSTLARARRSYQVEQVVGMFSPRFIALLALAHVAGRRNEAAYFRLNDLAMQYVYEHGPLWRLSYVVIFSGHR